jgi:enamine deaminase RidA (YjgF/YER057c/UK114 family)
MNEVVEMVEKKISQLGLELPEAPKLPPDFGFDSVIVHENWAYISGAMPFVNGELPYAGKVGDTVSIEEAQETARICIMNALSSLKDKIGSLDKVKKVVKITGFVSSASGLTDQALVMNAATDLLRSIFGEKGVHARTAVGVAVMPLNTPIEIEMIIALEE